MAFEVIIHDIFVFFVPTVVVLFGILLNRQDATTLRTEMANLRNEMKAKISQLRSETIALRDSIHRDMVSLHERVAVIEAKNNQ